MVSMVTKIFSTGSLPEPVSFLELDEKAVTPSLRDAITALYGGRSLRIRHVDAGSTNGEEYEMTALGNAYYDVERFGISFVASPRHADMLTVSGPVSRNMAQALKTAYEMMPAPKMVVAIGDGAITGGIWKDSYALAGPVHAVIPVDAVIPGDPPSPRDILSGLLSIITAARRA
ncbi:MAG: NADH-quinone oxidoreductase subunit B family protein [Minisyncoccota bacterium]